MRRYSTESACANSAQTSAALCLVMPRCAIRSVHCLCVHDVCDVYCVCVCVCDVCVFFPAQRGVIDIKCDDVDVHGGPLVYGCLKRRRVSVSRVAWCFLYFLPVLEFPCPGLLEWRGGFLYFSSSCYCAGFGERGERKCCGVAQSALLQQRQGGVFCMRAFWFLLIVLLCC